VACHAGCGLLSYSANSEVAAMTNAFTFLMLPPQTELTREWAARLSDSVPGMTLIVAEDEATAATAIVTADAAFGTLSPALLANAQRHGDQFPGDL
jgi:hypothetical protein